MPDNTRSTSSELTYSDTDMHSSMNDEKHADTVGLANANLSPKRRRMLDLTNRLHSTGVQGDIDLPQIAVIGSQSAGKSSLIESISGIKLPRASGTCTRCPTECRLSHSPSPWQCLVSLRYTTDNDGKALNQVRNQTFGLVITDRSEVEERIRRAQRAILNPATETSVFLSGEDKDPARPELTFSSNCVSIQISGSGVADLSFCDLPGLIASVTKGGNRNDMQLVQKLLVSYIEKPSCLILLTVACEADFMTQGAHTLAQEYDPDGKRTIGVLTKPDRIPAGDESTWVPYIQNEQVPLELGWYCVKQPDSTQLKDKITWAEARANETTFFRETEPWCSLPYAQLGQLGTENLIQHLSEKLSELISKRLPKLQDELQMMMQTTEAKLSQLPVPPSSDALADLVHLIANFSGEISRRIEGTPDEDGIIQSIRPAQEKFKRAIRKLAPNFMPFKGPPHDSDLPKMPPIGFLSNEEDEENFESSEPVLYIDQVMNRAQSARARELPDNYPFVVTQVLIDRAIQKWRQPAQEYFDATNSIVMTHIKNVVKEHFERFGHGNLNETVQMILFEHLKTCQERTKTSMDWLLKLEARPFTLNTHYLADYKDKFLAYYRGCRLKQSNGTLMARLDLYPPQVYTGLTPVFNTGMNKVMSGLGEIGIPGVQPAHLPKLLPPDPFDPALDIMSSVRAYYQVAYKRFTDNIPLAVDQDLVQGFGRGIQSALLKGILPSGTDVQKRTRELLAESPTISFRREDLQNKLQRLNVAKQELMQLW